MGTPVEVGEKQAVTKVTGHRWAVGAAIGVLTAGVALGTAELLTGLFGSGSSPIVAVGGAAVDASPELLKSFAIRTFGEQDKLALLIGIGAVLTIAVSLLGAASVRRPRLGIVGCVVLGAIGAAAAVTRRGRRRLPEASGSGGAARKNARHFREGACDPADHAWL